MVLPCLGALAASIFFGFSRADDEADRLFYRLMRWTPLSLREALTRWRWPTLLRIVDPLQMEFFGLCMATLAAALALQRQASPAMPSAFVFLEFVSRRSQTHTLGIQACAVDDCPARHTS